MPNAFQFINTSSNEAETFYEIDNKLRDHLGKPPSETSFYRGWYDAFGWHASLGRSFTEMRPLFPETDKEVQKMLDWFDANYRIDAWYEVSSLRHK
jgi:hypothetical protein